MDCVKDADRIMVGTETAARMLDISKRHFISLELTGKIGPEAIRLGRRKLYKVNELKSWAKAGLPDRETWQNNGGPKSPAEDGKVI